MARECVWHVTCNMLRATQLLLLANVYVPTYAAIATIIKSYDSKQKLHHYVAPWISYDWCNLASKINICVVDIFKQFYQYLCICHTHMRFRTLIQFSMISINIFHFIFALFHHLKLHNLVYRKNNFLWARLWYGIVWTSSYQLYLLVEYLLLLDR